MTALAELRQTVAGAIRRICEEPEDLTVTEWARKYRWLPETSTSPGPYDPDVVPYARRWQDLMADPSVSRVVLCWGSQLGKSTLIENAIGFRIHQMPSPMLLLRPKIDDAESWAKERFAPMVRDTPVLRDRVRMARGTDATLRYKAFPGGFLFVPSAQSATECASRSALFIACDEVDRMEVIPGEGNPIEIVFRRQGAADIGMEIITSTPRDAETTNIWPYLEGGTCEKYHVPCPACGAQQELLWDHLRWEKGHPETAAYACAACGVLIGEREKPAMLAAGQWVATYPEHAYPSSHLNSLYSPFAKSSWATLAGEWERARGKPADLQVFVNTRLAELWAETADVLEADRLLARVEPLEEGVVPEGVGVLTAGVDVQGNRLEVWVWGWGAGLESWPIAAAVIPGDPTREPDQPGSVWARLDEWRVRRFPHAAGGDMGILAMCVDSGYATSQVYRYTHRRRGQRVFASKGVGGPGLPILGKPTLQGKERVVLYPIGVDAAKNEFLRSQILELARGPGYVHLPDWLTSDQMDQLIAEKRVRRLHRGKIVYEWRPRKADAPNEALDCRNYARAALETQGPKLIPTLGRRAAQAAATPAPVAEASAAPTYTEQRAAQRTARPLARTNWVNRWRP